MKSLYISLILFIAFNMITCQSGADASFSFQNYTWSEKKFFLPEVFTIQGYAYASLPVDEVEIQVLITTKVGSISTAIKQNKQRLNSTLERFAQLKYVSNDDISIDALSVKEILTYNEVSNKMVKEFQVADLVSLVTTRIDKIDQILEAALDNGQNELVHVYFGVSDQAIEKKQEELIPRAIEDAKRTANLVLSPLNLKIYSVKGVYPQFSDDSEDSEESSEDEDGELQPTFYDVTFSIIIDFIVVPVNNKGFLKELPSN